MERNGERYSVSPHLYAPPPYTLNTKDGSSKYDQNTLCICLECHDETELSIINYNMPTMKHKKNREI